MEEAARREPVSIADIREAAERLKGQIERTPTKYARTLSMIAGGDLYLKFENFQFTASFKERGALNKLLSLTLEEKAHGVIAMSAGNHAQAVAYHAGRLGIRATIVMPEATPFNKIKHTQDFGARVIVQGQTLSDSATIARDLAKADGLTFVHPYDDPSVIAGQGTVGLELLADIPQLDALVVPIGGGGLIAGTAIAAKALKPAIAIYGVQAQAFPSMADVIKGTATRHASQSIAEGIAVKHPGYHTRAIVREHVADILLVSEAQIESALAQLLEVEKIVAEGAAATGYAAVLANRTLFEGRKIGLILSGGNIDMRLLSNVILRELTREGRIQSLAIEIEDRPGFLAKIAAIISEAGGNVLDVRHDRMATERSAKSATLQLTVEARDVSHAMAIRGVLEQRGFHLENGPSRLARGL